MKFQRRLRQCCGLIAKGTCLLNWDLKCTHCSKAVIPGNVHLPKKWNSICGCPHISVAAAAKSLQSCLTLCNSIDGSPPGSPVPGILQARTLERVAISFSNAWKWKVKVKLFSRVRLLVHSDTKRIRDLEEECLGHTGKDASLHWEPLDYAECGLLAGKSQQSSLQHQEIQRSVVTGCHRICKAVKTEMEIRKELFIWKIFWYNIYNFMSFFFTFKSTC